MVEPSLFRAIMPRASRAVESWRRPRMRGAKVVIVWYLLAIGGGGVAYAQPVNPLSVLDESRRDRLELDKRIARDQAAQRQKEQAAQAAQANAQRKLDEGRAASANSFGGATPPSQPEASTER